MRVGLVALICFLGGLLAAGPAPSEVTVYGVGAEIQTHRTDPLTRPQKTTLRWLSSRKNYFGAMSINTQSGGAMAVDGFHRLENARVAADLACRLSNPQAPDACVLFASLVPKGFSGAVSDPDGLSREAQVYFRGEYARHLKAGGFGAFAISGIEGYGAVWDRPTVAEAAGGALVACQASVARRLADLSNAARDAFRQLGWDRCRVVVVSEK